MAIITLNNNSLSSVTALPAGVGGKVLQIQFQTTTGEINSTSATYTTFGSAAVTLTTLKANSKFLCIFNARRVFNNAGGNNDYTFTDGTNLSSFQRFNSSYGTAGTAINPALIGIIYGTHSAGASITITPQFKTSGGTFVIGDTGGVSTHYVMEIE
jgi:L-2-hydroxyglutarate oxidase LhgO